MTHKLRVCGVQDLANGDLRAVPDAPIPLAICRVQDEWFAFENNCTHEDFPLTEGDLNGFEIECPLHGARFCLRTGEIRAVPATCPIRVFPVHWDDHAVHVELP